LTKNYFQAVQIMNLVTLNFDEADEKIVLLIIFFFILRITKMIIIAYETKPDEIYRIILIFI